MTSSAPHTIPTRAARLQRFLRDYSSGPVTLSAHSCAHMAAAWVAWCEGKHPHPALLDLPNDAAALRLLRSLGPNLVAACTAALQRDPMAPAMARVGDLVIRHTLLDDPDTATGYALGICCGATSVHLESTGAWVYMPMAEALSAWRVGGAA